VPSVPPPTAEPAHRRPLEREGTASKGDRRQQSILDALESLLTELPFAKLSIGQITARAGVGRTAFYFYFPSREAALTALVARSVEPIYEAGGDWLFGDDEPLPSLSRGLRGIVELWCEQGHLLAALIDAAAQEPAMMVLWRAQIEALIAAVAGRMGRDAARGLTWPGLPLLDTAHTLGWMTERYCYIYLGLRPWGRTPDEVHRVLVETWRHAIYRSPA